MERERQIMEDHLCRTLNERAVDLQSTTESIIRMGALIYDYLVPLSEISVSPTNENGESINTISFPFSQGDPDYPTTSILPLHDNAAYQFGERLGIPAAFFRDLWNSPEEWRRHSAVALAQDFTENVSRDRFLIRTIKGQARAMLSDKYRRLNTDKIFLAFLEAAMNTGSKIIDAHVGDTVNYLEVIQPKIIELDTPLNGRHFIVLGSRIRNSDFGEGAFELSPFANNVRCMNGLVAKSMLREIHLGGKIPDDIVLSDETVQKDTEALASLVNDTMRQIYNPETANSLISKIKGASEKEIDFKSKVESLPKLGVHKSEVERLEKVLMQNNPADGLFGAPTLWKFSNGLTAVARDSEPERKRELEKIASQMIGI